jgi:hypothetical protein
MLTKYKIIISVVAASVVATSIVVPILVLKEKCPESCTTQCGLSCVDNPKCVGKTCDDPNATCKDGVCVVKHSCTPSGECVPDPNGPFDGETCTCYSVSGVDGSCVLAGDEGTYKSVTACEARDSDFNCVPGTGMCERVLGSTTGWKSEEECKCFECNSGESGMSCVPSSGITGQIGGEECLECGLWKCTDEGGCVQTATGGNWEQEENCACGLCKDGLCEPAESGGAYRTVSDCETDGASMCKDPNLGWACNANAGNIESCKQTLGGSAASLEDCRCWTCAGNTPGPLSECVMDFSNTGNYATHEDCFMDEIDKCGWKYMCA